MKNTTRTSTQNPTRVLQPLEYIMEDKRSTPDLTTVCDWDRYAAAGLSRIEVQAASHLFGTARAFLVSAKWCDEILEEYVGLVHPGAIGVFLFRLSTRRTDIGEWGWVIAGNLPTGFIATRRAWSAPKALDLYVGGLGRWAGSQQLRAARESPSVQRTTALKSLERLKSALGFVQDEILPAYAIDLAFHE